MQHKLATILTSFVFVTSACLLLAQNPLLDSQTFHEGFEVATPYWRQGTSDSSPREILHDISDSVSHAGHRSEHILIHNGKGSQAYYWFPLDKPAVSKELKVSLWLRANRPGIRVALRVVLPQERQPNNLDQIVTVFVLGDVYEQPGQWKKLTVPDPERLLQSQLQLLRAERGRDVRADGAYVDQVLLNMYAGPGESEVWIDDLEASPVSMAMNVRSIPSNTGGTVNNGAGRKTSQIEIKQERIFIENKPFFMRGIRFHEGSLKQLREVGFNTLIYDKDTPDNALSAAVREGFWLMPELHAAQQQNLMASNGSKPLGQLVSDYPFADRVLAWHVGAGLTSEASPNVGKVVQLIRNHDSSLNRPIAGSAWDGLRPLSQHVSMIGVHRWPLASGLELGQHRDWLVQRSKLVDPANSPLMWTWVQTHWPESLMKLVSRDQIEGPAEELGPDPKQIRMLSYTALTSGCRGIGFWADGTLTDSSELGKARKLELAILNHTWMMLEPALANFREVLWFPVPQRKDVKLAVLRYDSGVLAIPMKMDVATQFAPKGDSIKALELVVKPVPDDAQAWLVTPVEIRSLQQQRVAGGVRVVIPDYDGLSTVLFTADSNLVGKIQKQAQLASRNVAQWTYDRARAEMAAIEKVQAELQRQGQIDPSDQRFIDESTRYLQEAYTAFTRGTAADYRLAYQNAAKAELPLNQIKRKHWEHAARVLDVPMTSPYAVSFFTLNKHWDFISEINRSRLQQNAIRDGGFENQMATPPGWAVRKVTLDDVTMNEGIVEEPASEGKKCWRMEIQPNDKTNTPFALERTYLSVTSPSATVAPGTIVRISGSVRVPQPLQGSVDGLLLFDNIGGEALAVRVGHCPQWKNFTLYRRVDAKGEVNVTVALTGMGTVYFDDLKIEPLQAGK